MAGISVPFLETKFVPMNVLDRLSSRYGVLFLKKALEHLSKNEVLLTAFGEQNITSYLKLKEQELVKKDLDGNTNVNL